MNIKNLVSMSNRLPLGIMLAFFLLFQSSCSDSSGSGSETDSESLYSVTYYAEDATSGTVPVDDETYPEGRYIYLPGNTGNLEKSGYFFTGWSTESDCSGTVYGEGGTFIMPANNVSFYACWENIAKIIASEGAENDYFGDSVSVDGDYVIVSATEKAYIFNRTGANTWDSGFKLTASDGAAGGGFGSSVANNGGSSVSISGDYAIVGAEGAGAVYIYQRTTGNTWGNETKISAPADGTERFGVSVSIDGDYTIVGAGGAAFIYQRSSGNSWGSEEKITGTGAGRSEYFGEAVSISGDYAIVGAYRDDDTVNETGAAFLFHRTSGNSWTEEDKIVPSSGEQGDSFGYSVAIHGDYAVAGAPFAGPDSVLRAGAVYIFQRSGADWSQIAFLVASPKTESEYFGFSVNMDMDTVIIGTMSYGGVYISERSESTWGGPVKTEEPESSAVYFGHSVAIDGSYAIIGASRTDVGELSDAGAVYIYLQD